MIGRVAENKTIKNAINDISGGTLTIRPKLTFFLIRSRRYQPIPIIAAIRNKLRASFPKGPPKESPKAMPSFSVKWMIK